MTENRPYAVWLRLVAGFIVVAGVLGLSACGGGSGSPANPFTTAALQVAIGSPDVYSQTPATLTVTGGVKPYLVTASKPNVLTIASTANPGTYTLLANNVGSDTPVLVTVQDSGGGSISLNLVVHQAATALGLSPPTAVVYSGFASTLSITGGTPPYTAFSSDNLALSVPPNAVGGTVNVVPGNVSADTTVTVTARDAVGATVSSAITVKTAILVNTMTLKADNYNRNSCPNDTIGEASPTVASGSTWVCSGQSGTVAVRLKNPIGGGLAGRQVRFDVVQGDFQMFTNGPGQPDTFGLSFTVPTDQDGNAVTRFRAKPDANGQIVIVQATDLASGNFVRGVFVIDQLAVDDAAQMFVVPSTVNITGPDTATCSSGVASTYFIFGGLPPYTISNTFQQFLVVAPLVVTKPGAGFTATTNGGCVKPANIAVTDSAGHTISVTLTNDVGTTPVPGSTAKIPITVSPSPVPTLACGASTNIVALGGGTIVTQNGTQTVTPASTLYISVGRPDILSAVPTNTTPGSPITLQRLNSGKVDSSGASQVSVPLLVSDGQQALTVNVLVTNVCP